MSYYLYVLHNGVLESYLYDIKPVQLESAFPSPGVPRTNCDLYIRISIDILCAVSYGPSSGEDPVTGIGGIGIEAAEMKSTLALK